MLRAAFTLAALMALLLPATASAHSLVEASELETLVVKDELSDTVTAVPGMGYDLGEFYVGEAYQPGIGDGLYVHTTLFGAKDAPMQGPIEVAFTFTIGGKDIVRTLRTTDRATFNGTFDYLDIEASGGEANVQRAFLGYASAGIAPGSVLTALKVACRVGGQLRDVAPGGYHLPEPTGAGPEVQDPGASSSQLVASYPLVGPVRYAAASLRALPAGTIEVTLSSLLKKGIQHVHLFPVDGGAGSFRVAVEGASGEVKPNGTRVFVLNVTATPDAMGNVADLRFNATTDIGGRLGFTLMRHGDGFMLETDGGSSVLVTPPARHATPFPAFGGAALAVLGCAFVAARRSSAS